jgi:creatinine amidohydrolase
LTPFDLHRFELLLPWQLRGIVAATPIAYVPLGTLEWHCEHLPVGLDALTAHGICLRVAARIGGAVMPALHFGTGGGHGAYPFTIMMPGADEIEAQLTFALGKLKSFGFKTVVLFSGHFPKAQLDMIDRIAARNLDAGFSVVATAVNRIEGLPLAPDHAGLFETTLLYALHPELVQMDRLPSLTLSPLTTDDWSAARHDPAHPVYGAVGPDPRAFEPSRAAALLDAAVDWTVETIRKIQAV